MTFKVGESGNPIGRPKGTGRRQKIFNNLVEPHQDALFDTAIKLALAGNEGMLRLFLERMLPAKPIDDAIAVEIPDTNIDKTEMLLAWGETILHSVSQGEITPTQADSLMAIIAAQRKNIETSELASRLIEIERILKQRKKGK